MGIAWVTDSMSISLPNCEINFSLHPFSLLHTLSLIWAKLEFFALPMKEGSLKYLSYCFIIGTPSMPWISAWASCGVDLLKKKKWWSSVYLLSEDALNTRNITCGGLAEEERIINKENVGDFWTASTDGDSLEFTCNFAFCSMELKPSTHKRNM